MAGGQERVLRRRIRSVQSTRKITKAMELIAASRIVRAQARIAANRPYRVGMEKILRVTAAADPAAAKKLLGTPESPTRVGILAVVGDRGLAGSYNSGVLRATERLVAEHTRQRRRGDGVDGGQEGAGVLPLPRDRHRALVSGHRRPSGVRRRARVAAAVTAPFVAGEMDLVQMVSTRFISAGSQRVETLQMLPLPLPDEGLEDEAAVPPHAPGTVGYTEFEPEPEKLLAELAPRAAESEIFAALLEGSASFFTAQQRAMAAATDNADELVRTLTRVMNRARQDSITTEIMEIVGGAEALRQSKGA